MGSTAGRPTDVLELVERDSGIEAAADDLFASATALAGADKGARMLRLADEAFVRFGDRLAVKVLERAMLAAKSLPRLKMVLRLTLGPGMIDPAILREIRSLIEELEDRLGRFNTSRAGVIPKD